jgi:hypothetical protein
MRTWFASAAAVVLAALTAGCDDTMISVSSDGQIDVAVSTSGSDDNVDGFTVSVDGGTLQFLARGSTVTLAGLTAGGHSVRLSGLTDNCRVDGSNPRAVTVDRDGRATVRFTVSCVPPTTGGFMVVVTTTGQSPDPDGYQLTVAGSDTRQIGASASETFLGLTAGRHLITLKDVDAPCVVTVGNPLLSTVVPGKTLTVRIPIACDPQS